MDFQYYATFRGRPIKGDFEQIDKAIKWLEKYWPNFQCADVQIFLIPTDEPATSTDVATVGPEGSTGNPK